jgi:KDO2-lipid IV(A) lauroyltransferase
MEHMRPWLLETLLAPVAHCPPALRAPLAAGGLAALDRVMPEWRHMARRNLTRAGFSGVERILSECYGHYRRGLSFLLWQHTLDRRQVERLVRVEGAGHIRRRRGRGTVFVTAHFGNWELGAFAVGMLVGPLLAPVQRSGYPALDAMLDRNRSGSGNRVIDRRGAAAEMLAHLRRGGDVGLLIDARPDGEAGIGMEFLSLPGMVGTTAARLRRATGADVVCVHMPWSEAEGRYVLRFDPAPALSGDVAGDTRALVGHFDGIIRRDPGQYLWIYDRWADPKPAAPRLGAGGVA